MTDKERIEEMAKVLHDRIVDKTWRAEKVAKELYKIAVPDGSVVLSKEEYEKLTQFEKKCHAMAKEQEESCREGYLDGYERGLSELKEQRENYVKKNLKLFARAYNQARKETAREFAEKLENGINNLDIILHEDNDEQYVSINQLLELIDEGAKQFGVEVEE